MENQKTTQGVVASTGKMDPNQITEKIYLFDESGVPITPTQGDVVSGGTTGQVYTKASSNDFDAEWTSLPAPELPAFPQDAKVYTLQLENGSLSWVEVPNGNE